MKPALIEAVEALEGRVRQAVEARRAVDPEPGDGFLGLHLSDARVDSLLESPMDAGLGPGWAPPRHGRFEDLARSVGLDELDLALLVVAAAPEVDRRFEWLYGYLLDDVTRKRASVGLALELADQVPFDPAARSRFASASTLVRRGLIEILDEERPALTRGLRVPDRVVDHLLGGCSVPELLVRAEPVGLPDTIERPTSLPLFELPPRHVASFVYVRTQGGAGLSEVVEILRGRAERAVALDLRAVQPVADIGRAFDALLLESVLLDATIVAGPIDGLDQPAHLRTLVDAGRPVVITGTRSWDPSWSNRTPLVIEIELARPGGTPEAWRLGSVAVLDPQEVAAAVGSFRLDAERTVRASRAAAMAAGASGHDVAASHVRAGARSQNTARLEELARRVEPRVGWDELVLPEEQLAHLHDLVARASLSSVVLDDWQLRRGGGRGEGIAVLFAGESGTGKTMSAEVLAGALGQDLYRIDLSTVVDKYIGETEKNLERIFTEAEHSNGVLFFDEADALFGKRSEVSDAHDRHANVEVAYLLQRMEDFSGLAVLATNLRANLDEAFTRRLTAMIDFPMPDVADRRRLWDQCLGPVTPRASDLDLDFCAERFELSGGSIRNITLAAAYRAAAGQGSVGMVELMHATRQEYVKMGRLVTDEEFGRWRARNGDSSTRVTTPAS